MKKHVKNIFLTSLILNSIMAAEYGRDEKPLCSTPKIMPTELTVEQHLELGFKFQNIKKFDQAIKHYKCAADPKYGVNQFSAKAQCTLGSFYYNGVIVPQDAKLAAHYYTLAAKQGLGIAQFYLGTLYEEGFGVPPDTKLAFQYYKLAADQIIVDAQFQVGLCYRESIGVNKDDALAFKYFKLAADKGKKEAQLQVGLCYGNSIGVKKNPKLTFHYFKLAADQRIADAQLQVGFCYREGIGVEKNPELAFNNFKLAADQGIKEAQTQVGVCYDKGIGVGKDDALAFKHFKLVADQGMKEAQIKVAVYYGRGIGTGKDDALVFKYYKLAADQRDPGAQFHLALCYREGNGVGKDNALAFNNFKLAADQGMKEAQFQVAAYYNEGIGVGKDDAQAFQYYKLAADQRDPGAQLNLGVCYYKGIGVGKDDALAFQYYKLAADQGIAEAHFNVGLILQRSGKYKEAFCSFKEALDQGCFNALLPLGELSCKMKDMVAAKGYFQDAMKFNVKNAIIFYVNFLIDCQNQQEAEYYLDFYEEGEFEESKEISPNSAKEDEDAPTSKTILNEPVTLSSESMSLVLHAEGIEKEKSKEENFLGIRKRLAKYLARAEKQKPLQFVDPSATKLKTYKDIKISVLPKVKDHLLGEHKLKIQNLISALANKEKRGKLKELEGYPGVFSMRLTRKDRLIFTITQGNLTTGVESLNILAVMGHYNTLDRNLVTKKGEVLGADEW